MQGRSFPLGPFPAAPCSRRSEADQEAPSISPEPSVTEGVLEPSLAGRPKEPAANAELAAAATATTNSAVASIPRTSGLSQPDTRANGARATAVPQSGTETAGFNRNQPETIWLCKPDSALPCGRSDDSPPCSNPRNASPPRRGVFCWRGLWQARCGATLAPDKTAPRVAGGRVAIGVERGLDFRVPHEHLDRLGVGPGRDQQRGEVWRHSCIVRGARSWGSSPLRRRSAARRECHRDLDMGSSPAVHRRWPRRQADPESR